VGVCGIGMVVAVKVLAIYALTKPRMSVWMVNALLAARASTLSRRSVGLY
jgi:hypothetical protein